MNRRDFLKGLGATIAFPRGLFQLTKPTSEQSTESKHYQIICDESQIANRVSVIYLEINEMYDSLWFATGAIVKTWFAENEESIARYGIREKVLTVGQMTYKYAQALRDEYLKQYAFPVYDFVYQ